ncbi:MAG: hypothetical protein HXM44_03200 [Lautropia mirabilis]|nr:hypothetical protein [Lautropia mirabilis]
MRGATGAMALAALAACGTTSSSGPGADYSSNSSVSTSGGNVSSPAAERVVDGVVELALTDQLLPDFDAARARKLGTVHDGQQLYLYLRSTRPLGEIAHPVDPYGKNSFSGYPHLFVQIGDNQSLRIINTCYVTLTPAEAKATELIVPLAPLTNRVGDLPTDCWLETVTRADAVRQTLEVRLAGFPGKFESWLPVPDLLGVVAVDTDLSQGSNAWGQMLRAKPGKSPELPAKGRQGVRRTSEREEAASKPVAASTEGRAPAQAGASAPDASRADAAAAAGRAQTDTSPRTQTVAAETPDRAAARTTATTQAAAPAEAGAQTAPAATPADRARSERESRIAAAMAAAGLTGGAAAATSGNAATAAQSAGNAVKAPAAQDTITRNEIVSMNQGAKAAEQSARAQDTRTGQPAAAQVGAAERSSDDARKAVAEQGASTARNEGREAASGRTAAAAAAAATTAGAAAGRAADADSAARPLPAQATLAALPAGAHLSAVTPLRPAPRQAVGTTRMVQQLQSMTSTLLGREPSETYFIDRRWQVQRDPGSARGRNRQVIRAIAIFRGEECSWQSLMVTRRPGAGTLSEVVADGDEVRIPCPDLKAQP